MKLSIVNFQNNQQDSKLVMTLKTEAQSYKCYGQTPSQPNFFYWNQNSIPQVSNKIKKTRRMSPTNTSPTLIPSSTMIPSSNNQVVYELSSMSNSLFNVSKRRRKQSLHSHEKMFSVNDNISIAGSSSSSGSNQTHSPRLRKKKMSNANLTSSPVITQNCWNSQTIPPTNQVSTPINVNTTMTSIPTTCQQSILPQNSFVPPTNSPRIVRSSILSIRELLN